MKTNKNTQKEEIVTEKNLKVHQDLYAKSNTELFLELENILSEMTEENFNFELVDQYLKVLQDRAPVMTDYHSSTEFARLQNEFSVLFQDNSYSRGRFSSVKRDLLHNETRNEQTWCNITSFGSK